MQLAEDVDLRLRAPGASGNNWGMERIRALATLFTVWGAVSAFGQEKPVSDYNVPREVAVCVKILPPGYEISGKINPFYLRGNFYGAVGLGYAVLIQRKHEQGIMFCRSGAAPEILGAGTEFHKMKDLNFGAWQVHPKNARVEQGVGERVLPVLRGDAIVIAWEESASALIYWNGKRFVWYQQGD